MRRIICLSVLLLLLVQPASAMEFTAPTIDSPAQELMPVEVSSFGSDLWKIVKKAISEFRPDLAEGAGVCLSVTAVVMLISLLKGLPGGQERPLELAGTLAVALLLLSTTKSMVHLGAETVTQLSEYGKLLLPVMTTAMAAQGGLTSSTALYTATAIFDSLLSNGITRLLIPLVYLFLALSVSSCMVPEEILKKLRDFAKWLMSWGLKILLYVFTGYISITGVVSGTADASLVKATKITMSGMVPVVGGILADASEAVVIGAGMMKNAVGVYGMLAVAAIWIEPFLQIGLQYLLLKVTAALCSVFGVKQVAELIQSFSTAMGLLLGMTGAVCILLLVSVLCFMKGMG